MLSGPAVHLTHRCHNGDFLFRFAKDRDAYRAVLRGQLRVHKDLRMLTYCITSNHVHFLLTNRGSNESVSRFMQDVQGQFAQAYNRRKNRRGAFWSDRYHATMIDSGAHLWRCMRYIDMNMVRAGAVDHPSDWAWCGFQELSGARLRYRLLEMDELCRRTNQQDERAVRTWYCHWMREAVDHEVRIRNPQWTESIAVGSKPFVHSIGNQMNCRNQLDVEETNAGWIIRETIASYSRFSGQNTASNEVVFIE
jgi:putative transposase